MASSKLNKRVVKLYVVKRPLQSSGSSGAVALAAGLPVSHKGCVVITEDGMMYLIEKGVAPDGQEELKRIGGTQGSRIVRIHGNKLPSDFRHVKPEKVKRQNVTLLQMLEASGHNYNWICNNCWNSTEQMQKIVSQELQLPWQMKAGMEVGLVGVFAMALFAIGRLLLGGGMQRH